MGISKNIVARSNKISKYYNFAFFQVVKIFLFCKLIPSSSPKQMISITKNIKIKFKNDKVFWLLIKFKKLCKKKVRFFLVLAHFVLQFLTRNIYFITILNMVK